MNDDIAERGFTERRGDLALYHFVGEVVERVFALPPSGIARRMPLERYPKIAAAVAEHHDRTRRRIDARRARFGPDCRVIARERDRGAKVETVARGGRANRGEYRGRVRQICK
jgi:hypothetical protein